MRQVALVESVPIRNARVMTCDPAQPGLGIIERASIVVGADGRVAAVANNGASASLESSETTIDAKGALVTPWLIDCHTHAAFAGNRAREFAMRAAGATYQEIAAAGGGIAATLGPT